MPQLEKLQTKSNDLTIVCLALGRRINQIRECIDAYERTEAVNKLVDTLSLTTDALEAFATEVTAFLEDEVNNMTGGCDADEEFY